MEPTFQTVTHLFWRNSAFWKQTGWTLRTVEIWWENLHRSQRRKPSPVTPLHALRPFVSGPLRRASVTALSISSNGDSSGVDGSSIHRSGDICRWWMRFWRCACLLREKEPEAPAPARWSHTRAAEHQAWSATRLPRNLNFQLGFQIECSNRSVFRSKVALFGVTKGHQTIQPKMDLSLWTNVLFIYLLWFFLIIQIRYDYFGLLDIFVSHLIKKKKV